MMKKIIRVEPLGFPWQTQDPFLFCAYHKDDYPKGNNELGPDESLAGRNIGQDFTLKDGYRMYHGSKIPGFPFHPHRGFETITITKEGMVDHADSLGASGRYGRGDVQWMTAGKGVNHSEMFPLLERDKDNTLEIFQVWLNLPKINKLVDPHYAMLWSETIPIVKFKDDKNLSTEIKIVAGQLANVKAPPPAPDSWANDQSNNVAVWTIKMDANAKWKVPTVKGEANRTLFFYHGSNLQIDNTNVPADHAILVDPSQEMTIINGDREGFILMLQGKPIKEPVAQYGPFVMNTQDEIRETINEYRQTEFGGWPWPRPDQVHDRTLGRFAKHANGKEEIK